ncbi:parathyroid hormone/parathyroid hormone-related peptide receptor-like [Copidosoma floridanum]|uniref:parathyroid hormone/parathyroid hormone-related peptide receptor-like n=1 Tax=Copidosoma floridanum TaxID=29053 RepID=UPI0006C9E241|nr:parathyroid hormone/parathyroid hormone-related peptide receptor-like [Copidosoma floridanum]
MSAEKIYEDARKCVNGTKGGEDWCPTVWDGLMCWPSTRPDQDAVQSCPDIPQFDPRFNATKQCLVNGSWYHDSEYGQFWTNYTECYLPLPAEDLQIFEAWLPIIKKISRLCNGISMASLVTAICILMFVSRKLRCARNTLHMNLFFSFIMRGITYTLRADVFQPNDELINPNNPDIETLALHCKALTVVWQYCFMANYFWIFMEGCYISYIVYHALQAIDTNVRWFIAAGWGMPAVFTVVWVVLKIYHENEYCWIVNDVKWLYGIIAYPTTAVVFINFGFFCYMLYTLHSKIRPSETQANFMRSIAILIPLFAAHYVILVFFPYTSKYEDKTWLLLYLVVDQLITSLQGLFVATILCFLNAEVRHEVNQKLRKMTLASDPLPNGAAPSTTARGFQALLRRFFVCICSASFLLRSRRHSEVHTQDRSDGKTSAIHRQSATSRC